jgi:hypothetical protein
MTKVDDIMQNRQRGKGEVGLKKRGDTRGMMDACIK